MSVQPVVDAVVSFLNRRLSETGQTGPLDAGSPVFELGLLDSLSLMELVAAVEKATGQTVDMLRFDPSAVVSVADLVEELSQAIQG